MKIQTKDCVAELNKHSNRKWKRYTKNTVLFENKPVDLREFHNKEDNLIGFVWATNNLIVKVVITEPSDTDKVWWMWDNKRQYDKDADTDSIGCELIYKISESIDTIPCFKGPYPDAFGDESLLEEQDFENSLDFSVESNKFTCCHGGDWQTPITVTYRLMKNGLYYADFKTLIRHNEE